MTTDAKILEFILEVEKSHFRTEHDTGANWHAMFIWNITRKKLAELPPLAPSDLPAWDGKCYAMPANSNLLVEILKRISIFSKG